MTSIRRYPVAGRNSTVCGGPGREYDWSKFCWDGSQTCRFHGRVLRAPKPFVDDRLIAKHCQYLHVPYDFAEEGTIYRVRPNESMWAGRTYRGILVARQTAELVGGVWCWVLYAERRP